MMPSPQPGDDQQDQQGTPPSELCETCHVISTRCLWPRDCLLRATDCSRS